MGNTIDSLSDDDIRRIALLVETLDRSTFDYLSLDVGGMKLTLGKGELPVGEAPAAFPTEARATSQVPLAAPAVLAQPAAATSAPAEPAQTPAPSGVAAGDDTVAIVAPIIGKFYATPQPGSPPFVSVGDQVSRETTVALIEVMKVFTAIPAGVEGVITEILVGAEQFVEYGQVLFRVRPMDSASASAPTSVAGKTKRPRAR